MDAAMAATADNWPTIHNLFMQRIATIRRERKCSRAMAHLEGTLEFSRVMDPPMTAEEFRKWDAANLRAKRVQVQSRGNGKPLNADAFAEDFQVGPKAHHMDVARAALKGLKKGTKRYVILADFAEAREVQSRLHSAAEQMHVSKGGWMSSILDLDVITSDGEPAVILAVVRK